MKKQPTDSLRCLIEDWENAGLQTVLPPVVNELPSASEEEEAAPALTFPDLRQEMASCVRCAYHGVRSQVVFGEGNEQADCVFLAEAPGLVEDQSGQPFQGRAGELLTKMMGAMGLSRESAFLSYLIKCLPFEGGGVSQESLDSCRPFLKRQLELLQPKVIVAMGTHTAKNLLDTEFEIEKLRESEQAFEGIPVQVTYHPAALLRNPSLKAPAWVDLQKVMTILGLKAK